MANNMKRTRVNVNARTIKIRKKRNGTKQQKKQNGIPEKIYNDEERNNKKIENNGGVEG